MRDATQEVSNDMLVYNSSSLSRKAIQPHLTSASVETGSLRPFRSGVMNLNQGPRRDYTSHRNRADSCADCKRSVRYIRPQLAAPCAGIYDKYAVDTSISAAAWYMVYTKSPWECDHFGCSMHSPRSFEEDIEFAKRMHDPMMPLDDDRSSSQCRPHLSRSHW